MSAPPHQNLTLFQPSPKNTMANNCTLHGRIPVLPNTTTAEIKSAIMECCKRANSDFMESEIDAYLSADESDENRIYLENGVVDVRIDIRGTAGFYSDESFVMAQAFNTLSTGPAWLVMTDHESSPETEGAKMLYTVGPTPHDRKVAKAAYGMSLAESFLQASGISAKHIEAIKAALIQSVGDDESHADAPMLVSLDDGETYFPAPGVRVIRQNLDYDNGNSAEVRLNITPEAVSSELFGSGKVVGADATGFYDQIARLYAGAQGQRAESTAGKDSATQVSLDGGLTYRPAPSGVRIIQKGMAFDDDVTGEVHLNVTGEGVITDLWAGDVNMGTDSVTFNDEIGRLYAPDDGPTP
jgi:hypothetical protein